MNIKGTWLTARDLAEAVCKALEDNMLIESWKFDRDELVLQLDRHTCELCASLDGQVFPSEEAPVPPLHWSCRCRLAPVFTWEDPDKPYGERPARMETEPRTVHHKDGTASTVYEGYDAKVIPAKVTYNEWMNSMVKSEDPADVAFAREALGPKRFELVESGKLKMESLYYHGKLRTIEELEELVE